MSGRKRPNSRRNLDIAIERMAEGRGDPLRVRATLAAAIVAQMLPGGVVKRGSALKLRFGDAQTRFTRDLDAAREGDLDSFVADSTPRCEGDGRASPGTSPNGSGRTPRA